MPMTEERETARHERELRKAGADRTRHRQLADEAGQRTKPLIVALRKAGYTIPQLAEISGYHERAVIDILRKAGLTQRQLLENARKRDTDQ